jgi:hypothetical protein
MRRMRFLRAAVPVAAVALLVGCGGPAITHGGHDVANAAKFTAALDAKFRSDVKATDAPVKLHPQARCYLATAGKDGELQDTAFCGPVLHQFGDKDKPYDAYPVTFSGNGDEPTVEVDGSPTAGVAVPDDVTLVRPDGETPPKSVGDLQVPPPPALEAGTAMALDQESGNRLTEVADGRLYGYAFRFQERGFARLDTVGKGTEQRRAADGEQLLLVRYDYTAGSGPGADSPVATLVVDGARTTLDDVLSSGDGKLFVVSVAEDAQSVDLEIAQGGVDQRLDLTTGERDGDAAAVLYREGADVQTEDGATWLSAPVNKTFSLPFAIADLFDGDYPTQLIVDRMDLRYWIDEDTHASSPDRALLQFVVKTSGGNTWRGQVDPADVVLVAADGTTYTAVQDNPDDNVNLINDRYWFEVPATFTGGTVTITPGVVHHTTRGFSGGTPMDYGSAQASFAVSIP